MKLKKSLDLPLEACRGVSQQHYDNREKPGSCRNQAESQVDLVVFYFGRIDSGGLGIAASLSKRWEVILFDSIHDRQRSGGG